MNSDKTIRVSQGLVRFVEEEVGRELERFSSQLTRAEVHLSDIDNKKTGQADKRCLIEVRPTSAQPLTATAVATSVDASVRSALRKVKRSLTTFLGRQNRSAKKGSVHASSGKTAVAKNAAASTKKSRPSAKTGEKDTAESSSRGPKKKRIYQARRKRWPQR